MLVALLAVVGAVDCLYHWLFRAMEVANQVQLGKSWWGMQYYCNDWQCRGCTAYLAATAIVCDAKLTYYAAGLMPYTVCSCRSCSRRRQQGSVVWPGLCNTVLYLPSSAGMVPQ